MRTAWQQPEHVLRSDNAEQEGLDRAIESGHHQHTPRSNQLGAGLKKQGNIRNMFNDFEG